MEEHEKKTVKKHLGKGMPVFNPHAAGIDIGDRMHDVAIDRGNTHEVRQYDSFTQDLESLVAWLKKEGITTVAMESTGVYWLNLYLLLEEAGIEPYLVNARHVKNVTGRKKDDTDAIWLQKLHSCGLLQKSFQPDADIRVLRTYVRQRKKLITNSSDSARRMQKALELMNIKLHTVISDILGKTGMSMVTAILNGERDVDALIKLKDGRVKASEEEIRKSLHGIWSEEHLFMLRHSYHSYQFFQSQKSECDEKIKQCLLSQVAKVNQGDITGIGTEKTTRLKKNEFTFDARGLMHSLLGIDLCQIEGISEISAVELIAEIGTNMSKWKNVKHFSAWLNLAPNTKITGGKIISSKMQKKKNQAGLTLRMAASNLTKSKSDFGDYARKMRSRLGKKGGVVAGAHRLARIIYTLIKEKKQYDTAILALNHQKWKEHKIKYLEQQLSKLKAVA
ncbi:MAG: IS110 family transposase [Imperialibacter sp.]|uniref:IS110 family transposase n=1 Tax=Imperialibacter sp. TaxID=2038411 RepID=UPI0032ECD362